MEDLQRTSVLEEIGDEQATIPSVSNVVVPFHLQANDSNNNVTEVSDIGRKSKKNNLGRDSIVSFESKSRVVADGLILPLPKQQVQT